MFKLASLCCLVVGSAAAAAGDYKFINADGSAMGQLCIAAVESSATNPGSLKSLASELGIRPVEVSAIHCNGKSLAEFAKAYSADKTVTIRTYTVSIGDQSPASQLCLAALVSSEEFSKLKESQFKKMNVEREIMCNGMPMNEFVLKYRGHLTTANSASR
jgi:hypothetical protein